MNIYRRNLSILLESIASLLPNKWESTGIERVLEGFDGYNGKFGIDEETVQLRYSSRSDREEINTVRLC